jgi:hypothetical protein
MEEINNTLRILLLEQERRQRLEQYNVRVPFLSLLLKLLWLATFCVIGPSS